MDAMPLLLPYNFGASCWVKSDFSAGQSLKKKPKAIDLFCGAGGLTEGLRQAGYNVIGAVELDALACRTYELNHKRVKLWEMDIARLSGTTMMKALKLRPGELDLLAACPPCQGFSTMRTKNGARWNRDSRNDLIFDVMRLMRTEKGSGVFSERATRGVRRIGLARSFDPCATGTAALW